MTAGSVIKQLNEIYEKLKAPTLLNLEIFYFNNVNLLTIFLK